jgi:stage V sporulation protein B
MKDKSFLKGAFVLAAAAFISKCIGALYKIPMLSTLGSEGVGKYQMVYPVFSLLLTIPACAPYVLSKFVAEGKEGSERAAFRFFGIFGVAASAFLLFFSWGIASLQKTSALGYIALSPALFFASFVYLYRGYFQGQGSMFPTAMSEVIEQIVKVGIGVFILYTSLKNAVKIPLILLAVAISEGVALCYLKRKAQGGERGWQKGREKIKIFPYFFSIFLSLSLFPLCTMVESFILSPLLKGGARGVRLYGLYTGGALAILSIPTSLCYGFSQAIIPKIAKTKGKEGSFAKSIFIVFVLSALVGVALYIFAPLIVKILFSTLPHTERKILIKLVQLLSISACCLPLLQTASASLTALGHPKKGVVGTALGVAVRLVLDILLVSNEKISIYGGAIAMNLGYFVAFFFDLVYNLVIIRRSEKNDYSSGAWRRKRGFDEEGGRCDSLCGQSACTDESNKILSKRCGVGRRTRNT